MTSTKQTAPKTISDKAPIKQLTNMAACKDVPDENGEKASPLQA